MPVRLSYLGLNATGDKTRIRIEQLDHGARQGDQVQLSGFSTDVSGLTKENLSARLDITSATPLAYEVQVSGVASGPFVLDLSLNLAYRHVDCRGTQRVTQGKLIKEEKFPNGSAMPPRYFNFTKVSRTEQTVVTRLQGCSPSESEFKTTRYFPYEASSSGPVRYPLIGQVIDGGDYSLVDRFSLPASQLKTGDTGTVALIANFADASRQNRTGRTTIRYEVLKHTSQSVFVALVSETYDTNDAKQVEMTDYYGRDPAKPGDPYSLVRTVVKYNNPRRTEMVIDYQAAPGS